MSESTTPEKLLEEFIEYIAPDSKLIQKNLKKRIPAFLEKWRSEP